MGVNKYILTLTMIGFEPMDPLKPGALIPCEEATLAKA